MQFVAISMFSASSEVRVPSLRDVERKSVIDRASRFFESGRDFDSQYAGGGGKVGEVPTMFVNRDEVGTRIYQRESQTISCIQADRLLLSGISRLVSGLRSYFSKQRSWRLKKSKICPELTCTLTQAAPL